MAVFCDFQPFDGLPEMPGACRCSRCGFVDWSPFFPGQCDKFVRICDVQPPGVSKKIGRYAKAVQKWRKAGQPRRTEGEILDIYENCCVPCKHFDKTKGSCTICGCYVGTSTKALFNKLAMATEQCAAAPPKWPAAVTVEEMVEETIS